jgi:hypothetical protein
MDEKMHKKTVPDMKKGDAEKFVCSIFYSCDVDENIKAGQNRWPAFLLT